MLSLTDGYPLGLRTYLKIKKQGCPPDLQGIVSTICIVGFLAEAERIKEQWMLMPDQPSGSGPILHAM